jgi:hypothetical protein
VENLRFTVTWPTGVQESSKTASKGGQNGIYCPGNEYCLVETAGIVGFGNQQRDISRPRVVKNQSEINVVHEVLEVLFEAAHSLRSGARSLAEPGPVANNKSSGGLTVAVTLPSFRKHSLPPLTSGAWIVRAWKPYRSVL